MSSNKNPDAEELSIIRHVHTGKTYEDQCVICLTWIDLSKRSNINHTNTKASCYQVNECRHTICTDCLAQYMVCALTDTRYITNCRNNDNSNTFDYIQCPSGDCEETFDADDIVRDIFSVDEANKWWRSAYLRNYMSYKIFCPFGDCESVMEADSCIIKECSFVVCYDCKRGFCSACQNYWHPGEVKKVIYDENSLKKDLKAAEKEGYCRCPECGDIVEKIDGCEHIECLCGADFCYRCGGSMDVGDEDEEGYCKNECWDLSDKQLQALRKPMFKIEAQK